ncbi:BTB/POZ domain-containing protein, partial [Tanacetum coccineum]
HPELTVTSEERVLNAILMWGLQPSELSSWEVVHSMLSSTSPEDLFGMRLLSLNVLLPLVRFSLLPLFLLKKMETSNLSLKIHTFYHLVKEAISFLETGFPTSGSHPKFQHRQSSFKELQYIRDGDSNGVLYYVGTSYGKHQWVNPVLAKKISIMASNPISRYTDPKLLASRTYQGTSFAGPRLEDGKNCSWWMVDLGPDHQLMCNYYTFRQDGSKAFMRRWNFQGSSDGKNWTNLRVHENDQTVTKPGQFASWAVTGPNALLPFRYFRVALMGPTTDDINPWTLCICFLELYGISAIKLRRLVTTQESRLGIRASSVFVSVPVLVCCELLKINAQVFVSFELLPIIQLCQSDPFLIWVGSDGLGLWVGAFLSSSSSSKKFGLKLGMSSSGSKYQSMVEGQRH